MTTATPTRPAPPRRTPPARWPRGRIVRLVLLFAVLVAVVGGTRIERLSSLQATGPQIFDPTSYGQETFPKQQAAIVAKAVPGATLAAALSADVATATKQYGVAGGTGPEFAVSLTGKATTSTSGIYIVQVPDLPTGLSIRVQTGPAINGTDIRDATGTVAFGQFTNQIDYQNAASALNAEMKKQVLAPLDTASLSGKTLTVVGVFQLVNPKGWLLTPVKLSVS